MSSRSKLEKAFCVLNNKSKELYLSENVAELDEKISPLEFHRKYISRNIPVVIRGGVKHWSAVGKWNANYFKSTIGDKVVEVDVTPNGYADGVAKERTFLGVGERDFFVKPEEKSMKMSEFLKELENPSDDRVCYIQRQNSNFEEFSELARDVDSEIDWVKEAFGMKPDAVNFWMGDRRAISSMHRDPYENIYCVISGEKEFLLHPPTDLPWIPFRKYPRAAYKEIKKGKWVTEPISEETDSDSESSFFDSSDSESDDMEEKFITWIAVDPLQPDYKRFPRYKNAMRITVKVKEGDILYLPSLWFHHVTQSHGCIAINYWYDMDYGIKYAYNKFLEALCE